ncbi:Probable cytochrome P450 6a13 [Camponotus floridanus]|uniref:Probable cytochrome P450 6a13 n=1 Tax=Camponotus floridanus TaxID=104421 RepID=E2ABJ6_CAMFO|nr:Probable cytochrome P450 6a13 [Camponotus floridanus]
MLKITVAESLQMMYKQFEGYPFVGIYELTTPVLLLRDPKLIKCILVKDFTCFQSRGIVINEHADPLSANLININGQRWRKLRMKLASVFTTSKTRHVFELITEVSETFKQFIDQCADNEEPVEFQNLAAKFTSEIIATCFFGLKTNTIQNGDSEFRRMCKKMMDPSLEIAMKRYVRDYMPRIYKWLSVCLTPRDVTVYFMRIVKEIIIHREMNNMRRNDIMQALIDLRYKETKMKDAQSQNGTSESNDIVIDDKLITAQAFIFLLAGFETSSTAMSFAMYELAANPKIQEKLYDEIQTIYEKHGWFFFFTISEMKYLDCIVHETLRKYPPVGATQRICEKSYKIPDSDVVLEKGTKVLVPIYAIHHDSLYYKNPNAFDPDRFIDENKKLHDNNTYLPFGDGPRICIGMKFAYIQIKVGLVTLMANYKVELSEKTPIPLQFEPTGITLTMLLDPFLLIGLLLGSLYFYLSATFDFWQCRGVPFKKPTVLVGNFGPLLLFRKSQAEGVKEMYQWFKDERFFGAFRVRSPVLILRDPDLVKSVFVKDFAYFTNRGIPINNAQDPLSGHLFNLEGRKWKNLRSKLTPAFSSGKMKRMFYLLVECCEELQRLIDASCSGDRSTIEVREFAAKFTIDVIGSCAFGIQINALTDEESEFHQAAKRLSRPSYKTTLWRMLRTAMPGLYRLLGVQVIDPTVTTFFKSVVSQMIGQRERNEGRRHDFMDLLIELKNKGVLENESGAQIYDDENAQAAKEIELDEDAIAAQAFVFFAAGYETSSNTIAFCLHELALNQEIQERTRREICNALGMRDNKLTYDAVQDMKYLDMVILETLRKYPPAPLISRKCEYNYQIPNSKVELPSGMRVIIPIYGFHHDPNYYPDPMKFNPERFTEENKRTRHPYTYLPFGEGPRNCIGMRFALLQIKMGIISFLKNHRVEICERSIVPIKFSRRSLVTTSERGFWLAITPSS